MAQNLNKQFARDPLEFLNQCFRSKHVIDNRDLASNLLSGWKSSPDFLGTSRNLVQYIDTESHKIIADLRPAEQRTTTFFFCPIFNAHEKLLAEYFELDKKVKYQKELFPTVKNDDPLVGYWCPYKTGGVKEPWDMGYVDVPKKAEPVGDLNFVFTGAMCGCHLVITDSPRRGPAYFRVWHYQNPGGNTIFTPPQWGKHIKLRNDSERQKELSNPKITKFRRDQIMRQLARPAQSGKGFPAKFIYFWFSDFQYPGLVNESNWYGATPQYELGAEGVFAFVFLYFHKMHKRWFLICLPMNQIKVEGERGAHGQLTISTRAPFAVPIDLSKPKYPPSWTNLFRRLEVEP